jgi:hypothetical protein
MARKPLPISFRKRFLLYVLLATACANLEADTLASNGTDVDLCK